MTSSAVFLAHELIRSWQSPRSRLRILFSERRSWRTELERSFRLTPHSIAFGELSDANMANADLVVPLTMPDLVDMAKRGGRPQPIPIPRLEVIELLDDKRATNHWMQRHEFAAMVPSMNAPHAFPYIVKKCVDQWGKHTHVVHDGLDETRYASQLASDEYFTQSLVEGNREYATHLLMRSGELVAHLNIEYRFDGTRSIKGQLAERSRRIVACPYLPDFVRVLRALDFDGLCCVNYKLRDDRPMVLEINPRFGGSLAPYFFSFLRRLALKTVP